MEKETFSRRSFLNKLWVLLGALTFAELIVMVIAFFKPPQARDSLLRQNKTPSSWPVPWIVLSPVQSAHLCAENSTWPAWRTAVSWPCREAAPTSVAQFPGYLVKTSLFAPAIPRSLISAVRSSVRLRHGPWTCTRCQSRTMCSRWTPANSTDGPHLPQTRSLYPKKT